MALRVTIAQVAKESGVSVCTVSRVLNGKYRHKISESTRQRVLAAANRLNYRPNIMARGLRLSQTTLVGLLIPSLVGSFIAEVVQGIQDGCEAMGFSTILYTTNYSYERIEKYIKLLLDKRIDGLLIYDPTGQSAGLVKSLAKDGLPVVNILFKKSGAATPAILVDHRLGAEMAVKYLLDYGHRHILHLSAELEDAHGALRLEGFQEAMAGAGLAEQAAVVETGWNWQSAYRHVLDYYSQPTVRPKPTAIFAASDLVALGAIKALYDLGISVPQEVSIIGFDDLPIAEVAHPGLTTIAQPKYQVGERAMTLLRNQLEGKPIDTVVLRPTLIRRNSVARRKE